MSTEPTDEDLTRMDPRDDAATEVADAAYSEGHDVGLAQRASTQRLAAITPRSREPGMTARECIEKAAADHGWEATIESRWGSEYRKGEELMLVYFCPQAGVKDVNYFRGDIGLCYLAPTSGIVECALGWLAGRH